MQLSDRAQKIYDVKLKPYLASVEKMRIESLNTYEARLKFAKKYSLMFFGSLSLIDYIITEGDNFVFVLFAAFFYFIYVHYPTMRYNTKFTKLISVKFLPVLFKELFNFEYFNKSKKIDKIFLQNSNLIGRFTYYGSEDYFVGDVNGINLECAELDLTRKRKDSDINVFQGIAVVLTMPFEFMSHTIVTNSGLAKSDRSLSKVNLEDLEFEKKYDTFSNNQQAARYLITPAFMKRTLDLNNFILESFGITQEQREQATEVNIPAPLQAILEKVANRGLVEYEFKGNKLLILIHTGADMFETPDINKSAYDILPIIRIEQQINAILQITEQLKLDYLTERKLATKKFNQ